MSLYLSTKFQISGIILTSFRKGVVYISRSLDYLYGRHKEGEVSRTVKQFSDKVTDLFINLPQDYTGCWERRQTLWILVSNNTVKKMKPGFTK